MGKEDEQAHNEHPGAGQNITSDAETSSTIQDIQRLPSLQDMEEETSAGIKTGQETMQILRELEVLAGSPLDLRQDLQRTATASSYPVRRVPPQGS